jgi:hypothetical protein
VRRACLSLPDVDEMAGEAARDDEHRVDPDVVAGPGVAVGERLGRGGDPAKAILVERELRVGRRRARLDLDEGDGAAAAGDEIDLADRSPDAAAEDGPALEAKPPGGIALGPAAAAFGPLAVI